MAHLARAIRDLCFIPGWRLSQARLQAADKTAQS